MRRPEFVLPKPLIVSLFFSLLSSFWILNYTISWSLHPKLSLIFTAFFPWYVLEILLNVISQTCKISQACKINSNLIFYSHFLIKMNNSISPGLDPWKNFLLIINIIHFLIKLTSEFNNAASFLLLFVVVAVCCFFLSSLFMLLNNFLVLSVFSTT